MPAPGMISNVHLVIATRTMHGSIVGTTVSVYTGLELIWDLFFGLGGFARVLFPLGFR